MNDQADSAGDRSLEVTPRLRIPRDEFRFEFMRSSGPGGQNVNKVSSKVRLRWNVEASPHLPPEVRERFVAANRRRITTDGELLITSQRYRDQAKNIEDCLARLRELLLEATRRPKRRKKTKPSRGAVERRLKEKKQKSARKQQRKRPRLDE